MSLIFLIFIWCLTKFMTLVTGVHKATQQELRALFLFALITLIIFFERLSEWVHTVRLYNIMYYNLCLTKQVKIYDVVIHFMIHVSLKQLRCFFVASKHLSRSGQLSTSDLYYLADFRRTYNSISHLILNSITCITF